MSCIIHQIWLSEDKSLTSECPPTSFQTTMNRWKSSHPRSQYILWTDISVETLLRNEFGENILAFYESLRFLIEKVNFAKYCILYHYGGIYADGNIECVADHETIFRALPENALFFVENPNSRCLQVTVCYLMASRQQHPFLARIICKCISRIKNSCLRSLCTSKTWASYFTGSLLATSCLDGYQDPENKVFILNRSFLFPQNVWSHMLSRSPFRNEDDINNDTETTEGTELLQTSFVQLVSWNPIWSHESMNRWFFLWRLMSVTLGSVCRKDNESIVRIDQWPMSL